MATNITLSLNGASTNYTFSTGARGPAGDGGGGTWGSITGDIADQTDLDSALSAKAPLDSPEFTTGITTPNINGVGISVAGSRMTIGFGDAVSLHIADTSYLTMLDDDSGVYSAGSIDTSAKTGGGGGSIHTHGGLSLSGASGVGMVVIGWISLPSRGLSVRLSASRRASPRGRLGSRGTRSRLDARRRRNILDWTQCFRIGSSASGGGSWDF